MEREERVMRFVLSAFGRLALVAALGCWRTVAAAEPFTEHTFQLAADEAAPTATLEDVGWLVGDWVGTAFDQTFEEVWNPPSAGSMVGLFKLIGDEGVEFYELMTLTVDDGTLSLKVKHFNADFTAWEEKADFIDFRLVKIEPDAIHFSGLSFYKRADGGFDGYIVFRSDSGFREEKLIYTRRR
jgi:hypothetical protein